MKLRSLFSFITAELSVPGVLPSLKKALGKYVFVVEQENSGDLAALLTSLKSRGRVFSREVWYNDLDLILRGLLRALSNQKR